MKYTTLLLLLLLIGCSHRAAVTPNTLTSLNLVDQSGLTQTIGSKERLKNFAEVDFCKPQPYQKVLRVFTPHSDGSIPAVVTSYYPSGQIKQLLSIVSGRAHGPYREWYENGLLKIDCYLLGGSPELGASSERTWIFHGPCKAYSDAGKLIGSMTYCRGALEGEALYFEGDGTLLKKLTYSKGLLEGVATYNYPGGHVKQTISYHKGVRHGPLLSYHNDGQLWAEEHYQEGRLWQATYQGAPPEAAVKEGSGARYTETPSGYILEEIRSGEPCGAVKEYQHGRLVHSYHMVKGMHEGLECYWNERKVAYVEIPYKEGRIQGELITRYSTGELQSMREMSNNQKNGLLRTWYRDGQIMMVEEYSNDLLQTGSYYKKGSGLPVARVLEGSGTAYIFDGEGALERKIPYKDGRPT